MGAEEKVGSLLRKRGDFVSCITINFTDMHSNKFSNFTNFPPLISKINFEMIGKVCRSYFSQTCKLAYFPRFFGWEVCDLVNQS